MSGMLVTRRRIELLRKWKRPDLANLAERAYEAGLPSTVIQGFCLDAVKALERNEPVKHAWSRLRK